MLIKYEFIQIYGSHQRYATWPQEAPEAGKSVLADFPKSGDEISITFTSEIPSQISQYVKTSRASAIFSGMRLFSNDEDLPETIDEGIEYIMTKNNRLFQANEFNWYILISMKRKFNVDDNLIINSSSKYTWLDHTHFYALQDIKDFCIKSKEQLNSMATYISFLFGSHYIENLIVHHNFISDEQDGFVLLTPKSSGSMSSNVFSNRILSPGRFSELLEEFRSREQNASGFKAVMRWRILFVREKDELKKFFYGFWALEVLINSVSSSAQTQTKNFIKEHHSSDMFLVQNLVKSLDKANIVEKFKVMQCALNCQDGEDLSTFKKLAELRNHLAHGESSTVPDAVSEIQKILDKYLAKALKINGLPEVKAAFDP